MPTGGGPYPPPPPKVAVAHAVAEPVQASYDDNYVPSSPYVPGTVVQEPVAAAPIAGYTATGYVPPSGGYDEPPSSSSYQQQQGPPQPPQYQPDLSQQGGRPVLGQPAMFGQQQQQQQQQQILMENVDPRQPLNIQCPHCARAMTTIVRPRPNGCTFLGCFFFAILGLWPCMFIPFCVPSCQGVLHACPLCRQIVAIA